MQSIYRYSTLLLVMSVGAVYAEDKKTDGPEVKEKVTYNDHVLPIFRSKCGSCHNASDKKGGLVLDNYAAMMLGGSSGTVIEAGDAGNSYLFNLVTHSSEPTMPPNADKLPAEQLAMIEKWINMGALENSGSKAAIKKKPSLAKIEVSNTRPADVAFPQSYYGDSIYTPRHANAVTALAVSPWASLAAVSGYKQIGVYDSRSFNLVGVLPFPEGHAQIAKFSRNGSLLLVGGGRGGESGRVVIYDVRTGERKVEVGEEYDEILGADISSDQTLVALGGPKKILRVYSVETGELLFENKKHTDWLTAIEFSPDGVLLASGDRSNGLIVWEAGTGEIFYDLQGHKAGISDVSWRPDSNVVASASEDGTIKLWEMQNGGLVKSWDAHGGGVTSMEYTRDGNIVSAGRDRLTRYWKGDGAKIRDLPAVADIAMEVAFDAETNRILTGDWTGKVTIWNAEDATQLGQIDTNPPSVKNQITQATAGITQFKTQLEAQQASLAGIEKGINDRKVAAEAAQKAAAQMDAAAKAAETQKQQAEAAVKAQQTTLEVAEKAAKDAESGLASLTAQLQQQTEKLKTAQATFKATNEAAAEANKVQQSVAAFVAELTAKAASAAKAAEPTEAEKAVIETDEAVKNVIAQRQADAKKAQDDLNVANEKATAAQAKVAELQKGLDNAKSQLESAEKAVQEMDRQMTVLKTGVENAEKGLDAARKAMTEAKTQVAAAVQKEQAARKSAADAQVAFQQATEAAKPKEEEQKGMAAAQAAVSAAQTQLQEAQAHLQHLQKVEADLSKATSASKAP